MSLRTLAPPVLFSFAALVMPAQAAGADVTFGDDLEYSPPRTTIQVGESVTWRGNFAEHPLASASGAFADKAKGSSYSVAFGTPGTYTYFCQLHSDGESGMVARIVVRPAASAGTARVAPRARVDSPARISPRSRVIRVTATAAGRATATLAVTGSALASGRTSFVRAGTRGLGLRLTAAARSRLRQAPAVAATLRVRLVGRSGTITTFTRPVRLVR